MYIEGALMGKSHNIALRTVTLKHVELGLLWACLKFYVKVYHTLHCTKCNLQEVTSGLISMLNKVYPVLSDNTYVEHSRLPVSHVLLSYASSHIVLSWTWFHTQGMSKHLYWNGSIHEYVVMNGAWRCHHTGYTWKGVHWYALPETKTKQINKWWTYHHIVTV